MPDLNLNALNTRDDSFAQLKQLAECSDGPLRLKMIDNIPHLGVRDWSTYFFEKITGLFSHDFVKSNEKEAIKAIEKYVNPALRILSSNSGSLSRQVLMHQLYARTIETSLEPKLGAPRYLNASTTEPKYQRLAVTKARLRVVDGMMIVPDGLSMTTRAVEKVMADLHLLVDPGIVTVPTGTVDKPAIDYSIPKTYLPVLTCSGNSTTEEEFYQFYHDHLKSVASSIKTCVAVELLPDTKLGVSMLNRNGAVRAASVFMAERKRADKPVSVSLCVKTNLPEVTKAPYIALSDLPSGPHGSSADLLTLYMPDQKLPEIYDDKGVLTGVTLHPAAATKNSNHKTEDSSDSDTEYSSDDDYPETMKVGGKKYRTGEVAGTSNLGRDDDDVED